MDDLATLLTEHHRASGLTYDQLAARAAENGGTAYKKQTMRNRIRFGRTVSRADLEAFCAVWKLSTAERIRLLETAGFLVVIVEAPRAAS